MNPSSRYRHILSGDCPVAVALNNLLCGPACGQRSSLSAFAVCDAVELLPTGQPCAGTAGEPLTDAGGGDCRRAPTGCCASRPECSFSRHTLPFVMHVHMVVHMSLQSCGRISLQKGHGMRKDGRRAAGPFSQRTGCLPMMSARRLTQPPDSLGWSWLTSAACEARPGRPAATRTRQTGSRVPRPALSPVAGVRHPRGTPAHSPVPRCSGGTSPGSAAMTSSWCCRKWPPTPCATCPGPGQWHIAAGLLQPHHGSGILCAVTDPGPSQPQARQAAPLGESGRGLQVIAALSQQWGHTAAGEAGKIVWAVVSHATAGLPRRERQPRSVPRARPVTDPVLLARVLRALHGM
jgi:hypothetical protein